MKKKILIIGVLAVLMLVTTTFASAVEINSYNLEKKDSPLYRVRSKRIIGEKINLLINHIKAKFIGERLFFMPLQYTPRPDSNPHLITEEKTKFTCFPLNTYDWCAFCNY